MKILFHAFDGLRAGIWFALPSTSLNRLCAVFCGAIFLGPPFCRLVLLLMPITHTVSISVNESHRRGALLSRILMLFLIGVAVVMLFLGYLTGGCLCLFLVFRSHMLLILAWIGLLTPSCLRHEGQAEDCCTEQNKTATYHFFLLCLDRIAIPWGIQQGTCQNRRCFIFIILSKC